MQPVYCVPVSQPCFASMVADTQVTTTTITTSSLAITERPHCRVGQFWSKVKDDILQII